ncbi:ASB15 [Acrasis kona]|uniref:ASB15 n=1 Tax=Acrasis kona TaxID=1008807 RepID=A0AAW2ZRI6_9EUKA
MKRKLAEKFTKHKNKTPLSKKMQKFMASKSDKDSTSTPKKVTTKPSEDREIELARPSSPEISKDTMEEDKEEVTPTEQSEPPLQPTPTDVQPEVPSSSQDNDEEPKKSKKAPKKKVKTTTPKEPETVQPVEEVSVSRRLPRRAKDVANTNFYQNSVSQLIDKMKKEETKEEEEQHNKLFKALEILGFDSDKKKSKQSSPVHETDSESDSDVESDDSGPKKRRSKATKKKTAAGTKRKRSTSTSGTKKKAATKRSVKIPKNSAYFVGGEELYEQIKDKTSDMFDGKSEDVIVTESVLRNNYEVFRAVNNKNAELLQKVIENVKNVSSVFQNRSVGDTRTALDFAIKNNDLACVKILLDENYTPKPNRIPTPTPSLTQQGSGKVSQYTYNHRVQAINSARGSREGDDAFLKDKRNNNYYDSGPIYTLKNNTP